MTTSHYSRTAGYCIILAGLLLAGLSAVVPFYLAGYHVMFSVFLFGITPYLVYAVAVELLKKNVTIIYGLLLLAAHVWLVVSERLTGAADYSDGVIYYAPLVFSAALIPLLIMALRAPYHD